MNQPRNKQNNPPPTLSGMPSLAVVSYGLLVLAVLLAYSNVYDNEFVFDDLALITGNKFLASWHYIGTLFATQVFQGGGLPGPFYRPLLSLVYLLVYQTAGASTIAFHLLNVALHAVNVCLLYTLGIRLGFQRVGTFLATLIWALHPVQTEAVTYMSGTADLLCGAFLLGGTLALIPGFSRHRVLGACALFAVALLSKETAVIFPLLAMGLLFYCSQDRWSPRTYLKTWPFWLMTIFYYLMRETVLNFNGFVRFYNTGTIADTTMWDHCFTFIATLPVYLQLLIWPTDLHMERGFPVYHIIWDGPVYRVFLVPQIAKGIIILTALFAGITWKPSQGATPLAWGLLWAAAVHIPQNGILIPNDALVFEHWLYLPTMGLFLGTGESLAQQLAHVRIYWVPRVYVGFVTLIACIFGIMTFEQNKMWRDPVTFYTHIFDSGENSLKAHLMLGNVYVGRKQYASAIEQYRRMLSISDNNADAHYNLGAVLFISGHDPASIAEAKQHLAGC